MSITKETFELLAREKGEGLVSIYMPTHRAGRDVRENSIRFGNRIAEVERLAEEAGIDGEMIGSRLGPLRVLEEDVEFWRHQADGLAVFVNADGARLWRLDHSVEEFSSVGDRFALRPLLPSTMGAGVFYVLALGMKRLRLVRCTKDSAREIDQHDIPTSLEDALGYDHEEKSLQFHSAGAGVGGGSAAVFHGHGSASESEHAKERHKFLVAVDRGLMEYFRGVDTPLVLAGDQTMIDRFVNISKHHALLGDGVPGSPDMLSADDLREKALPIVRPVLEETERRERERVLEAAHSKDVKRGIEEVLPELRSARVATLLVEPSSPVWGEYDREGGGLRLVKRRTPGAVDVLSVAVCEAIESGAEVLPADGDALSGEARALALLRF